MVKKYTYKFILTCLSFFWIQLLVSQNVSLDFDGVDDYIPTNTASLSGNTPKTVEAWIKTTKNSLPTASGGQGQSVIADFGTFINGQRFTFNILWSNAIRLEVGGNGLSGTIAVNDGSWHHVAVTYNPSTNPTTSLYVDGILDVRGNLTVPVNTGSANNLRIGSRIDGVNFFQGAIDEVRVFNIARDSTTIYNEMSSEYCGSLPSSLVAYYKLNEGIANGSNLSNTLAKDYVSNNTSALLGFALNGTNSNWVDGPVIGGPIYTNLIEASCDMYTSPSGNYTWSNDGTYYDTLVASSACDSILIIDLDILQSSESISVLACGSYTTPSGKILTSSGMYQDTLVNGNAFGCDSIISIDLTIGTFSSTNIDTFACDTWTWNGTTYTSSALINDTLSSGTGCDSVIVYHLNMYYSADITETYDGCDSVEAYGMWYYTSQQVVFNGTTNSIAACDSTHTLDIIVGNSSTPSFESITACDSIEIEGTWYTSSTNLELLYTNTVACDSSHFIDLTIESIDYEVVEITDWTVTINDVPGATYNWYTCPDSTLFSSDSIGYFTPGVIGEYYVEIVLGNCSYSSPCILVIGESVLDIYNTNFNLTPNPNNGSFFIDLGQDAKALGYEIYDVSGRVVLFKEFNPSYSFEVNTPLENGVYFIIINSLNGKYAKKFMVK